ncbi:MAG: chloride channel protein [Lachnospiraceae bacterium]|nr:chloride channel protein [Lachnospiraceae bacterium]
MTPGTKETTEQEFSKEHFKEAGLDFLHFIKNLVLALVIGAGVGAYACLFALLIDWATGFRNSHSWLIFLLPVGGLAIVGFYHLLKVNEPGGTNRVLKSISSNEELPLKMTPLITVSTAITHLLGGSAGREGAALQIGGSLGSSLAKVIKADKKEVIILTMCGMSAAFSAMFGTPLTATIFAMEVVSIGILHYSAIVPCAVASLTAGFMAKLIGYVPESYPLVEFPNFTWLYGIKAVGLGLACAVISVVFIFILHKSEHYYKKFFKNPYLRTVVGGLLIMGITLLIGTRNFNGAGVPVIFEAIRGNAEWYTFLLKMIMTALTLGACYKGGEIIPTIFVGAAFGCVFGPLIGIPAAVGAAMGVCGVFCGVTNCPLASIALSFELFGIGGLPFMLIVAAVSYRLSGYYGIYTGQKIMYSKDLPEYINITTKE